MRLGFIGFGGAAYGLSKGLRESGSVDITFFDSQLGSETVGHLIRGRGEETGAQPCENLGDLIDGAEVIISCVTGSVAVPVAAQAAAHLTPRHTYVDVNTASPKTMEEVFSAIRTSGAPFADVAMMGGIPVFKHRVPCLASGNGAERFITLMEPYGMDITVVGNEPGQASAIKMFRSIFMKGFLALLLEMLTATHRYQVDSIVLDSLAATMAKNDFLETVRLQLAKGVVNAGRMSLEMEAVVQTLAEMDLSSTMAAAAREKLQWCDGLGMADRLGHNMETSIEEILDTMASNAR